MVATSAIELDPADHVLTRVFRVAPLVVVGTVEEGGGVDLAPKHMTMPVGEHHVAFVCTPDHATLRNVERTGEFTLSWIPADGVVLASLTAAPRQPDGSKPALAAVATRPATVVDGVVLRDAPLSVECRVDRVVDGFGRWAVVVGAIVHAEAAASALLTQDEDPHDVLAREPVLAYLDPRHVATIAHADHFPFHEGFSR